MSRFTEEYLYDSTSEFEGSEEDDEYVPIPSSSTRSRGGVKRKVKDRSSPLASSSDSEYSDYSDDASPPSSSRKKTSASLESEAQKKRRVRYGWACSMCKMKHRSCDGQRPCQRCKSEGFADTCCEEEDNGHNHTSETESMHESQHKTTKKSSPFLVPIKEERRTSKSSSSCVADGMITSSSCSKRAARPVSPRTPVTRLTPKEQEIIMRLTEEVALRALHRTNAITASPSSLPSSPYTCSSGAPSPMSFAYSSPQEDNNNNNGFLFQFLEPPTTWRQRSPSPSFIPSSPLSGRSSPSFVTDYLRKPLPSSPSLSFSSPEFKVKEEAEEEEEEDLFATFQPAAVPMSLAGNMPQQIMW